MRIGVLILCIGLLASGCTTPKYRWGNYEDSLYDYYGNPGNLSEYKKSLRRIIDTTSGEQKIAPGIYAEYAYLLYSEGQYDPALTYFQKEKDAWPESASFVDRFIGTIVSNNQANITNNTN